ncbi:MAG: PASTA domain-containing protein [Oscillospiraceae bacterium]|nr:PASTA domain-containing protein [Oscillospiraceae bacterium]
MLDASSIGIVCVSCFTQHPAPVDVCPVCGYNESAEIIPPHQLRPRTFLSGKYLLGKALGEGGFGITYIGYDLNLDIKVAIKEYYPSGVVTRENATTVFPYSGGNTEIFTQGRDRFVREAKTLAKFFSLPGIVSVKDYFQENGTAYIVMEFVDGNTLKDRLSKAGGRLPAGEVLEYMKPVIKSLYDVHNAGIIHRDISPDNIIFTKEGNPKLIDFGAARGVSDGQQSLSVMLKHGFAPEEQYRTRGVQGAWTDIYAMCATIYRAITGVTPDEALERLREDTLKPPRQLGAELTAEQEAGIMKGLAVNQKDRHQTVMELYGALYGPVTTHAFTGVPVMAAAPISVPATAAVPVSTPEYGAQSHAAVAAGAGQTPQKTSSLVAWVKNNKVLAGVLAAAAVLVVLPVTALIIAGSILAVRGNQAVVEDPATTVAEEPAQPAVAQTSAESLKTGILGTWIEKNDNEIIEIAFDENGKFYMIKRDVDTLNDGLHLITEGTYEIIGDRLRMTPVLEAARQGDLIAPMDADENRGNWTFDVSIEGDVIAFAANGIVTNTMTKEQPSGLWGFNRSSEITDATIEGTWISTGDIGGEIMFNNEGEFYLVTFEPEIMDRDYYYIIEGTYTTEAAVLTMKASWAAIHDEGGYDVSEIEAVNDFPGWTYVYLIKDNTLSLVDEDGTVDTFKRGQPSDLWSFEHRAKLTPEQAAPAQQTPAQEAPAQQAPAQQPPAQQTPAPAPEPAPPSDPSVPDVTGRSESSAVSALQNAGFKVTVQREYSGSVKEGNVISQSPRSGGTARSGSTVTITVSRGPEKAKTVTMPNLVGMQVSKAVDVMRDLGINVSLQSYTYQPGDNDNYNIVFRTNPSAGSTIEVGSRVTIYSSPDGNAVG